MSAPAAEEPQTYVLVPVSLAHRLDEVAAAVRLPADALVRSMLTVEILAHHAVERIAAARMGGATS